MVTKILAGAVKLLLLMAFDFFWHGLLYANLFAFVFLVAGVLLAKRSGSNKLGWCYFAAVEVVAFDAMVIGWFLLIIPCIKRAWVPVTQIYIPTWQREQGIPAKRIFIWQWYWLNRIWGNDEDGVVNGMRGNVEYNPEMSAFKAYLWCAWRNSANNLRFVFRWNGGPFYRWEDEERTIYFQCGWNSSGFPVLSAGAI